MTAQRREIGSWKTVKLSLSMPRRHKGGAKVWLHSFLTSALQDDEWSTSRPCRFTPQKKKIRYPLNRRLGGPYNFWTFCNREKLVRTWKKAVVAQFRYYPHICLEDLSKTTKNVSQDRCPGTSSSSQKALSLVGIATYKRFELTDTRNKCDWNKRCRQYRPERVKEQWQNG
jgi:hypothetical protein